MTAVVMATCCHHCGAQVAGIAVEPGESWNAAVLFGYVAQVQHEREAHPVEYAKRRD